MTSSLDRVVIIGASAAGLTTAEALRRHGYSREIVLVGNESHLPYDRPPLSKQVLLGTWEPERTFFQDADFYAEQGITLALGNAATGLDLANRTVRLSNGAALAFDRAVIATGVTARRLPSENGLDGVHVIRTLDDAITFKHKLESATNLVVIGAGFLGCETAATARQLGVNVTLVDAAPTPMHRPLGPMVGRAAAEMHEEHGVNLRMGVGVRRLDGEGAVSGVVLDDGCCIPADLVLVSVGSTPATEWLAGSGLQLADGVVCDAGCQAAPGIYAAGDVARWHNPRYGVEMRVEHRMNATEQAQVVAKNILGDSATHDSLPYFWTDQYDAKIQGYGVFPAGSTPTVVGGDPADRKFVARYESDGRVTAAVGWNMARDLIKERRGLTDRTVGSAAC